MKKKLSETDLFKPIKDLLLSKGYKICSEIEHCDVAGIRNDKLIIIELKKSFNINVLLQVVKRQKICDFVYIAVPYPINSSLNQDDILHLLKRLELGLIYVHFEKDCSFAEVVLEPIPFDRGKSIQANKKKKEKLLSEFAERTLDTNIGGSVRKKLLTAYRDKSLYIACCINIFGQMSPKELKFHGADEKKTYSILSKNFYGWFYRVEKGVYGLSDEGKKALDLYKEITEIHKKNILS